MARKNEDRLLQLIMALSRTDYGLSKEQLYEIIPDYAANLANIDNLNIKFERDKEDLREIGIELEVISPKPGSTAKPRYRIDRALTELPEIDFNDTEKLALRWAGSFWNSKLNSEKAKAALRKLGMTPEPQAGQLPANLSLPKLANCEASLVLQQAIVDRQAVEFEYRKADDTGRVERRRVQPWKLVLWNGGSYLVGFDRDRKASRTFKLLRIQGQVRALGKKASYELPDQEELNKACQIKPSAKLEEVILAIKGQAAPLLRRLANPVDTELAVPTGYQAYRMDMDSFDSVQTIASYGPQVLVLAPSWLRASVIHELTQLVAKN